MAIKTITSAEIAANEIESNLPDRPSEQSLYGKKSMTAREVKAAHDKLPKLIAARFNEFVASIPGVTGETLDEDSLAAMILTGIEEGHSLRDLFMDVVKGNFAAYIKLADGETLEGFYQRFLNSLTQRGDSAPDAAVEGEEGSLYLVEREGAVESLYFLVRGEDGGLVWIPYVPRAEYYIPSVKDGVLSFTPSSNQLPSVPSVDIDSLPTVSDTDNGKVLTVDGGTWVAKESGGLSMSQAPGDSETAAMSQKAVTQELAFMTSGLKDNIFPSDSSKWQNGSISGNTVTSGNTIRLCTPDMIPVEPSTEYKVRIGNKAFDVELNYYSASGSFYSATGYIGDTETVTTPSGAYGVRFVMKKVTDAAISPDESAFACVYLGRATEKELGQALGSDTEASVSQGALTKEFSLVYGGLDGNLFPSDPAKWANASILGGVYTEGNTIRLCTKDIIPVESASEYRIHVGNENYDMEIVYYVNGNFYSSTDYVGEKTSVTTPQTVNGIRIIVKEMTNKVIKPTNALECCALVQKVAKDSTVYDDTALLMNHHKNQIRVMTHNLGQFHDGTAQCPDDEVEARKEMYKELLASYQPDIIFTQENPQYADASNSVEGNSFYDYRYTNFAGTSVGTGASLGMQFITNYPLFDFAAVPFSNERSYNKAYTYINGNKVALYNLHLSLTPELRAVQISEVIADMNAEEYVILGGDFNNDGVTGVTPESELQPFVDAGYRIGNDGSFITYGESSWIDNVIVSANINIRYAKVENTLFESLGDHRPLMVVIELSGTIDEPSIPMPPKGNGEYLLKATVKDGAVSYEWVEAGN